MVDGISECEIASVGVGNSGVGEGVSVAVARSSGVGELTAIMGVAGEDAVVGSALWRPGRLHARMAKIRSRLNVKTEVFFFMVSLLMDNYHSFCKSNQ